MWLAHALSLSRIPLGALFWLTYDRGPWSASVVALAAITDWLDGWVARRARPEGSEVGGWLDPLADKLFVIAAIAAVAVHERPPAALIALITARELVMIPLFAIDRIVVALRPAQRHPLRASALGKVATVAQFAAVLALIARWPWVWVIAVIAAGAGLAAVGQYVWIAARSRTS